MARPTKRQSITTEDLKKEPPITLSEAGDREIEKVADTDFVKEADLESFMNEIVTIRIHEASEDGALEVVTPNVNALNQPIIRGLDQQVKRKYVEALARCRTTRYEQRVIDPSRPENIQMQPRTLLTYPFDVVKDPNPKGREWLKAILAQP